MTDILRLDGHTAAITGAASGIGRAIAQLFAARGAAVGVLDIDERGAATAAGEILAAGGSALAIPCDVARADSVAAAFDRLERELGPVRIVVNNAGIAAVGAILETTEADLDRLYAVNVKGVFHGTREGVRRMQARGDGGAIVNIASIASLIGVAERFAYSMTKGAVLAMTRSTAIDTMKDGIRCNCICPARIHTPFVDGFLAAHYPGREAEKFRELADYQPMGRMGTPEEVALLALYLASDAASFITGAAIPLDGGVLVR